MDFWGAPSASNAGGGANWNETGTHRFTPASALAAYFAAEEDENGLRTANSKGEGRTVIKTAHDDLFAWLAGNGDNVLGENLEVNS